MLNSLADRIRYARRRSGLSQTDIAKSLRVTSSAVNQWEQGTIKSIKLEYFFSLANLLGTDPQWLGTGVASKNKAVDYSRMYLEEDEVILLMSFRMLSPMMRKKLITFARGLADVYVKKGVSVPVPPKDEVVKPSRYAHPPN